MALTTAYMASVKNLGPILEAIKDAGVPPRFTNEFLKSLGFTSSNDRSVLNVLKGVGFLDQQGVPTERYRQFRDKTESRKVLAQAMREAYADLFLANQNAQQMPPDKIRGFFASTTDKGDRVVEQMASTFRALAQHADFSQAPSTREAPVVSPPEPPKPEIPVTEREAGRLPLAPEFHYNIQIHLPATRDITVYNAIFKSLRENLLK